jgi:hypothetical protein
VRSAPALAQAAALIESDRVPLSGAERARGRALADLAIDRLRQYLADWPLGRAYETTNAVNYLVLQADYALRLSPSLDALRRRADFQHLVLDADFPAWPFADDPSISAP